MPHAAVISQGQRYPTRERFNAVVRHTGARVLGYRVMYDTVPHTVVVPWLQYTADQWEPVSSVPGMFFCVFSSNPVFTFQHIFDGPAGSYNVAFCFPLPPAVQLEQCCSLDCLLSQPTKGLLYFVRYTSEKEGGYLRYLTAVRG